MEHVLNLLLDQVTVDHGAVSGLFNGEVAPVAGEVECLGRFVVLVMEEIYEILMEEKMVIATVVLVVYDIKNVRRQSNSSRVALILNL